METVKKNKNRLYFEKEKYDTNDLLEIVKFLRSNEGCPWDRAQTHDSIKQNAVEEAYEVVDAIDSKNPKRLYDELGDLLLQVIFHSNIAQENKSFSYEDVVTNICRKLISRHSFLFGDDPEKVESASDVKKVWEKNKKKEKKEENYTKAMKEIPKSFPSLLRANKIQKKAAHAGFDWTKISEVAEKVEEEFAELKKAKLENNKAEIEEELGDLLFSIVNYSRFIDVDPEIALNRASDKFINRFSFVEDQAISSGMDLKKMSIEQLDPLWKKAKAFYNKK